MIFLKEGQRHSKSKWVELLGLSQTSLLSIIEKGILKPLKDEFVLMFVGELVSQNSYAFSFPKCVEYSSKDSSYSLEITKAAIKKYHKKLKKNKSILEHELKELHFVDDYPAKEYEVYLTLKSYYFSKGVYKKNSITTKVDPSKKIYWKKTIQNSLAYISDDTVNYFQPYTNKTVAIENEISSVFVSVLTHLHQLYEKHGSNFRLSDYSNEIIPFNVIDKYAASYCRKLQVEISETFNSEDLAILLVLLQYISGKLSSNGETRVRAYGSNSFHHIWEDICKEIFVDDYETQISNFSQPKWFVIKPDGTTNTLDKGRLIPDVIWNEDNTNYILDAKYYYPFPQSSCGVGDIAKQYIYADISGSTNSKNIFIFPGNLEGHLNKSGLTTMVLPNGDEDPKFSDRSIPAVLIDYHKVVDSYIGNGSDIDYRNLLKSAL